MLSYVMLSYDFVVIRFRDHYELGTECREENFDTIVSNGVMKRLAEEWTKFTIQDSRFKIQDSRCEIQYSRGDAFCIGKQSGPSGSDVAPMSRKKTTINWVHYCSRRL